MLPVEYPDLTVAKHTAGKQQRFMKSRRLCLRPGHVVQVAGFRKHPSVWKWISAPPTQ